jgi:hypothetical protein
MTKTNEKAPAPQPLPKNDEEYFALEAFSASGAKLLLKSPAHFRADRLRPHAPTPAMQIGTLTHRLILEPEKTPGYALKTWDARTKEGKARAAEVAEQGLVVIDEDIERDLLGMRASVMQHATAGDLVRACVEREVPIVWDDLAYGIKCKAKLDALAVEEMFDTTVIVDLKTAVDASPKGFARAVANFSYHIQAAHYAAGLELARGKKARFVFVVVEKVAPYAVGVYTLDEAALSAGRRSLTRAKMLYAQAIATNQWPAYGDALQTLSLPSWVEQDWAIDKPTDFD